MAHGKAIPSYEAVNVHRTRRVARISGAARYARTSTRCASIAVISTQGRCCSSSTPRSRHSGNRPEIPSLGLANNSGFDTGSSWS